MRILVTKDGNTIIQELDNSNSNITLPLIKRNFSSGHFNKIKKKIIISKLRNNKEHNSIKNKFLSVSKFNNNNKNNVENDTYTNQTIKKSNNNIYSEDNSISVYRKPKYIKLKSPKLIFPKQFSERYEKDNNQSIEIIRSKMNCYIPSITIKNINPTQSNKQYYSFIDIISNENIKEMRKKIVKEYKEKKKDEKITEKNFRSIYRSKSVLDNFNYLLLNPIINSNKINLIKYINEKKMDPITLKSLSEKDQMELDKIDQVCKIYYMKKEKDTILNDYIKNKANAVMNEAKEEFQNVMRDAENKVDDFKTKLEKYNTKINAKEKYKELLQEIKHKHWRKFNLNRFNKKGDMKLRLEKK